MLIKLKRGWEMRESEATPEQVFLDRRRIVQAMGMGALIAATGGFAASAGAAAPPPDPSAGLYPVKRNDKYTLDRPITDEKLSTHYNNFYEFTEDKDVDADALPIRPWTVQIDGMVEKPMTIDIDDLLKRMQLEERLYRHRCVEAWSMAVPWSGFPLKDLVALASPLGSAKYVRFETFQDAEDRAGTARVLVSVALYRRPDHGRGDERTRLHGHRHVWPSGAAPGRRAAAPRDAVEIRLQIGEVDRQGHLHRPAAQDVLGSAASSEYGFWANINPDVPHPRWSQATERVLGQNERVPTLIWNGYGEYVAHMYDGLKGERLFA